MLAPVRGMRWHNQSDLRAQEPRLVVLAPQTATYRMKGRGRSCEEVVSSILTGHPHRPLRCERLSREICFMVGNHCTARQ